MRELHGVADLNPNALSILKRHALLLDSFYLTDLSQELSWHLSDEFASSINAELRFLQEHKLVMWLPHRTASIKQTPEMPALMAYVQSLSEQLLSETIAGSDVTGTAIHTLDVLNDMILRGLSAELNVKGNSTAPLCQLQLPETLYATSEARPADVVLKVALEAFPAPDEQTAWQDILDFKDEAYDKQWAFRRWLYALATKSQIEAEIRDEIEWMVNEYKKAMELHHIKASQSFVDVFVISPLEIIENLVKFNWSKIAKGILSVQKRRVELLEAEMKAPGRACSMKEKSSAPIIGGAWASTRSLPAIWAATAAANAVCRS